KKVAPKLEVHLSTQHSTTNSKAIEYWKKEGADRVVLARECTLCEIKDIAQKACLDIEVFIHGGMCISYSGRCTLSNHMTNRDANRGGCAQSCRWKYKLLENDTFIHDEKQLFSMSSKDMMAANYIQDLISLNVRSLKIEGRMKSTYYIATVIRAYRMLIDRIYEGKVDETFMKMILDELSRSENRPTSVGFYAGKPKAQDQLYGVNGAGVTQEYIASILKYDSKTKIAMIQVKNHFEMNIPVEVFGANYTQSMIMNDCYDENGEKVEVANKPMQILTTKIEFEVKEYDMIRKIVDKSNRNVY
ncbi:MAG: U32 family peptidase, partial [Traorella sp.]